MAPEQLWTALPHRTAQAPTVEEQYPPLDLTWDDAKIDEAIRASLASLYPSGGRPTLGTANAPIVIDDDEEMVQNIPAAQTEPTDEVLMTGAATTDSPVNKSPSQASSGRSTSSTSSNRVEKRHKKPSRSPKEFKRPPTYGPSEALYWATNAPRKQWLLNDAIRQDKDRGITRGTTDGTTIIGKSRQDSGLARQTTATSTEDSAVPPTTDKDTTMIDAPALPSSDDGWVKEIAANIQAEYDKEEEEEKEEKRLAALAEEEVESEEE